MSDSVRVEELGELSESVDAAPVMERSPEQEIMEKAAKEFTFAMPEFQKYLRKIKSLNSLARVFYAAAEFPLGNAYPKFKTRAEMELFLAFNDILQHKNVLITEFTKELLEKGVNNVPNTNEE